MPLECAGCQTLSYTVKTRSRPDTSVHPVETDEATTVCLHAEARRAAIMCFLCVSHNKCEMALFKGGKGHCSDCDGAHEMLIEQDCQRDVAFMQPILLVTHTHPTDPNTQAPRGD